MDIMAFLGSISLSKGLGDKQLEKIAEAVREKTYRRSQMIISEKDSTKGLFILVRGKVKMFKSSIKGKEQILYIFRDGEAFGMCAAFTDSIFPANAMAMEKTEILFLPSEIIDDMADDDPRILFNIIHELSFKLKDSIVLAEALSLKEITQRVASYILTSSTRNESSGANVLELTISHRELAKMLGSSPETLSRTLKKISEQGVIKVNGRTIITLDKEALVNLARS